MNNRPSFHQSISSTRLFAPMASFAPRFFQSMPSTNKSRVFTRILRPAPSVLPSKSQSMLSTRLLNVSVNAFTKYVIFGPTLSQLIASYIFCRPALMPSAIYAPRPDQSSLLIKPLILSAICLNRLSISAVSNISAGDAPPPPPPLPESSSFWTFSLSNDASSPLASFAAPPVFFRDSA